MIDQAPPLVTMSSSVKNQKCVYGAIPPPNAPYVSFCVLKTGRYEIS